MKYYNTIECCEKWFALRLDVCVHACMHYWLHERLTENCKLRTMQNEYEGQHTLQMYLGLFSDCFIRRNDINVANFCRNHSFFGFYTCRMCVLSVILLRHTWNFDNVTILLSRYIFKLREWIYGEKKRRKKNSHVTAYQRISFLSRWIHIDIAHFGFNHVNIRTNRWVDYISRDLLNNFQVIRCYIFMWIY